jgi:hypothetical protein
MTFALGSFVDKVQIDPEKSTLVFDRSPIARIFSCAAAFGAGALFFDYLSGGPGSIHPLPLAGLSLLLVGTILAAMFQYGDRIYVGPEGLLYENRLLPIAKRGTGWLRWDEVVEVREVRRKILVLLSDDGRRILVDAIAGYSIARREILRRTPHAAITGTLEREDRA